MKRLTGLLLGVAAAALIGCGDSSVECGEGTAENDEGFCVPTGGDPVTCSDGTMLDETSNTCVIDPAACQNGTVLIDGACKDPTGGVTVDVTEAAEPNALGFFGEPSADPAGEFLLKPVGGAAVVVQGNLNPQTDRDEDGEMEPDFDTYLFEAEGPTLLEISVDGVGGAAGAFAIINGDSDSMAGWLRVGVNRLGDTGKRQVYLPQGGIYVLVVSDTRSFLQSAAVGDANNKYYASIKQLAVPTATAMTFTDGVARALDNLPAGEVKLYSATLGTGFNSFSYLADNTNVTGSMVVTKNGGVRVVADEDSGPATALLGGFSTTDAVLIVADELINANQQPTPIDLQVKVGTAAALSTTGGTATATNATNPADGFPQSLDGLKTFYFDVNGTGDTLGLNLSWNVPVDGVLVDENGAKVNDFSYLQDAADYFGGFLDGFGWYQWTSYKGLFRAPAAGRYYLMVWGPQSDVGDNLVATSTIAAVTPGTLTAGTPITGATPNAYNSNPYLFNADNAVWDVFTAAADTASGGFHVEFYATNAAFGRLDNLVLEELGDPGVFTNSAEAFPEFVYNAAANNTREHGHVMLGGPTMYYAKVNTTAGAGTFGLGASTQVFSDEGTHAGPYNVTHPAQTFNVNGNIEHYYLLRTTPGSEVEVTVTPNDPTSDLALAIMDEDEAFIDDVDVGFENDPETITATADENGWVAIEVYDWAEADLTFDIEITVTAPTAATDYYTVSTGTTTWSNACTGGQDVTPLLRDDGFTNPITIPTGFDFFANAVTAIKVSTNGWFTFDSAANISAGASGTPQHLPSATAPNAVVAAYWADLDLTRICTKTVGTKFIVQWRGVLYGTEDIVATQAILDTADDSIEIVHAPYTSADGAAASSGVESSTGSQGTSLFFNEPVDLPGTSKKLRHL